MRLFECCHCLLSFNDSDKAIKHSFEKGHVIRLGGKDGDSDDGQRGQEVMAVPSETLPDKSNS